MPTTTTYENIDYGSTDGSRWGRTSTELIAVWGGVPAAQLSASTGVVITTFGATLAAQTGSSAGFGASTAAIMTSTFTAVNALMVDMAEVQRIVNNIRSALTNINIVIGS